MGDDVCENMLWPGDMRGGGHGRTLQPHSGSSGPQAHGFPEVLLRAAAQAGRPWLGPRGSGREWGLWEPVLGYTCPRVQPAQDMQRTVCGKWTSRGCGFGLQMIREEPWACVWRGVDRLSQHCLTRLSPQWRAFLPGLKFEVIGSAHISLYTGAG